jgi:hypothetical protein
MGSNSSSNAGNSGSDAFVNKKSKVKPVKRDKFGYTVKENPVKKFISSGGVTGAIISGLTNGEEVNRKFFEEKVKPAGKSKYDTYEDYIRARGRGEVDAYGRTITKSDNGGAIASSGQVVQSPEVTAPTTAEVSQATTTDAVEDPIELRKRRVKAKGRNPTIMTGVTGVTADLTLGKPSLLGRA